MLETSILKSTKKLLGLDEGYQAYDHDVITFINSAFSSLEQLGVGVPTGFMIEDATTEWSALIEDDRQLNLIKTYVFLKVRSMFDPPTTSFLVSAMKEQIQEHELRISIRRESIEWVDPDPPKVLDE